MLACAVMQALVTLPTGKVGLQLCAVKTCCVLVPDNHGACGAWPQPVFSLGTADGVFVAI